MVMFLFCESDLLNAWQNLFSFYYQSCKFWSSTNNNPGKCHVIYYFPLWQVSKCMSMEASSLLCHSFRVSLYIYIFLNIWRLLWVFNFIKLEKLVILRRRDWSEGFFGVSVWKISESLQLEQAVIYKKLSLALLIYRHLFRN